MCKMCPKLCDMCACSSIVSQLFFYNPTFGLHYTDFYVSYDDRRLPVHIVDVGFDDDQVACQYDSENMSRVPAGENKK